MSADAALQCTRVLAMLSMRASMLLIMTELTSQCAAAHTIVHVLACAVQVLHHVHGYKFIGCFPNRSGVAMAVLCSPGCCPAVAFHVPTLEHGMYRCMPYCHVHGTHAHAFKMSSVANLYCLILSVTMHDDPCARRHPVRLRHSWNLEHHSWC